MNHGQTESKETQAALLAEGMGADTAAREKQQPLQLSVGVGGRVGGALSRETGKFLVSFETPHPKGT